MEGFTKKTNEWCDKQHYTREGQATETEFSEVAHRLFGTFFLNSMSLEEIVAVTNCMILARLRPKPEPAPDAERNAVNANLDRLIDEHVGGTIWIQGKKVYQLVPDLEANVAATLNQLVDETLGKAITELRQHIKDTALATFTANLPKIDALVQKAIDTLTNNYVKEKVVEKNTGFCFW
jgi:hypothetical protein